MHLAPLIRDLALIGGVAGLVTLLFQRIHQPVVLGYIVAGVILGPYTPPFPLVTDVTNVRTLAEIGVIFLMFTLGLEFSFRRLVRTGRGSFVPAIVEMGLMMVLGFVVSGWMGWPLVERVFTAAVVAISSTTIIMKTFGEMGLKRRRFAEVVFGILIIEDLVAILLLVALTTAMTTGELTGAVVLGALARLLLVAGSWFVTGYFVVPRLIRQVGRLGSDETLVLVSVALCLGLSATAAALRYPVALGAFIMGSILSETREARRIEHLVNPLKDWFGAIFFVSVGMLIDPRILVAQRWSVFVLALVVLFGKTFSVILGGLIGGERLGTAVRAGMSLAQIGEFSFIIATLGLTLGVVDTKLYPVTVAVSVLTTFITPYWVRLSVTIAELSEKHSPSILRRALAIYGETWKRVGAVIAARPRAPWRWRFPAIIPTPMETRLAPWDGHLVRMRVHPESNVAGKSIADSALRKRLGVNVVVIQRGEHTWVSPAPTQLLFPHDDLLVLGTDEQIALGQREIEEATSPQGRHESGIGDFGLQKIWLMPGHPLSGKSIRQSGIREEQGGIVVGIERDGKRLMNPDTDLELKENDTLWVVGPVIAASSLP